MYLVNKYTKLRTPQVPLPMYVSTADNAEFRINTISLTGHPIPTWLLVTSRPKDPVCFGIRTPWYSSTIGTNVIQLYLSISDTGYRTQGPYTSVMYSTNGVCFDYWRLRNPMANIGSRNAAAAYDYVVNKSNGYSVADGWYPSYSKVGVCFSFVLLQMNMKAHMLGTL